MQPQTRGRRGTGGRPKTGKPNPIDVHVGSRVRLRRTLLGMSQEKLGEAIGLTFQQVQKYEKGTNRVSASRLQQIATLLGVEVGFFYEGAGQVPGGSSALDRQAAMLAEVSSSSEGVRLINSFARISDPVVRREDVGLGAAHIDADDCGLCRHHGLPFLCR